MAGEGPLPGLWDALTWLARREGLGVERASCGPSDSMTSWSGRRIVIRPGLNGSEAAGALLHELGHVLADDGLALVPGTSTAGCRGVRKVEADSVAFTVATRLGMDTSAYSWPYVASWAGSDPRARPEETIRATGERVTVAVATIAAHLDVTLIASPSLEAAPAPALTDMAARGNEAAPRRATAAHFPVAIDRQAAEIVRAVAPEWPAADLGRVLLDAEQFYVGHLKRSWVPGYLVARGLHPVAVAQWHIGYAPAGWTALIRHSGHLAQLPGAHVRSVPEAAIPEVLVVVIPDGALDELVSHELIAALAGDEQAREAIRGHGPGLEAIPGPDQVPLADEFLVLDADSSQNYAINAVLSGQSLIIKGPPGTGKSQTIANLIASLIARGKKVLFVAEKRAAIDAVTKRLSQQNLGELVLDLHGGVSSRRAFAQTIGQALDASRNAPHLDNGTELQRVERRREQLNAYVRALHRRREPWNFSVYDMRAQLLGLESARTEFRFRGAAIEALSQAAARQAAEDLADYARLGGLTLSASGSPWASSPIVSAEEVRRADEALDEVRRHALPTARALLERASSDTSLPEPQTLAGWAELIDMWVEIGKTLSAMTPAIYEFDLEAICEALAPAGRGGFGRLWAALTSTRYRAARARLSTALLRGRKLGDRELWSSAVAGRDSARKWSSLGGSGLRRSPRALTDCHASYKHLLDQLAQLEAWSGQPGLAEMRTEDCEHALNKLDADRGTLARRTGSAPAWRRPGSENSLPRWEPARQPRNSLSGPSGTPGSTRPSTTSR